MRNQIFYFVFFVTILSFSRILPHPPNFTPILAAAIVGPMLFKDRLIGILIPVLAMFLGDVLLGFHSYQLVVYLTLITISLFSPIKKNYIKLSMLAVGGSIWFFITTNFSVWLIWDYYPKNIEGLITCYTMAIPFFKNTLISTCFFTCIISLATKILEKANAKINDYIVFFINKTGISS